MLKLTAVDEGLPLTFEELTCMVWYYKLIAIYWVSLSDIAKSKPPVLNRPVVGAKEIN